MGLVQFFSGTRVAVATIFLAITLASIVIGGPALALFLAVLIYFGSQELVSFAKAKGFDPNFKIIIITSFLLLFLASMGLYNYLGIALTFGIVTAFLVILFRGYGSPIADLSTTLLGIIYGGWLPMHIILLRNIDITQISLFGYKAPVGLGLILLIFFVISLSDIAAYYIGKKFGRTPLYPKVSPKKTLAGAIAGTIGGVFGAVLVGIIVTNLSIIYSIIGGFILSITAQLGDLCESMLKRDAGVKDSGTLVPGHGGVLDRADSYIFTGAVAYYFFSYIMLKSDELFYMVPW